MALPKHRKPREHRCLTVTSSNVTPPGLPQKQNSVWTCISLKSYLSNKPAFSLHILMSLKEMVTSPAKWTWERCHLYPSFPSVVSPSPSWDPAPSPVPPSLPSTSCLFSHTGFSLWIPVWYSWPLNNLGLNYMGPLMHSFFFYKYYKCIFFSLQFS